MAKGDDRIAANLLEGIYTSLDQLATAIEQNLRAMERLSSLFAEISADNPMAKDIAAFFFTISEGLSDNLGFAQQIRDRISDNGYAAS